MMLPSKSLYWLVPNALLVAACGTVSAWTPLREPPHPMHPRPISEVAMFTNGLPNRPYVEVGIINFGIQSTMSGEQADSLLAGVRKEAASRGCDGAIVTDGKMTTEYNKVMETDTYTTYAPNRRAASYKAVCVVYSDQ